MTETSDADPGRPALAPPTLPDHPATYRAIDPAAVLAFRTPLQEHPPAADTKAAGILSAFGIMFALLARYGGLLTRRLEQPGVEMAVVLVLLVGFAVLSSGAIVQSFRTIFPRFPDSPPSLAYFGDIAKLSREEYIRRVTGLSHDEALEEILVYNYTVSAICVDKFYHLRRGVRLLRAAFACWLALIVLVNVRAFS